MIAIDIRNCEIIFNIPSSDTDTTIKVFSEKHQ
jgi:hypothetical protein